MEKTDNLEVAMNFFLENSEGSIICINGNKEKECKCFPEAKEFLGG